MELVHWPECTNDPCTCGERGELLFRAEGSAPMRYPPTLKEAMAFQREINRCVSQALDSVGPIDYGDCISCDGYILAESEKPHCPTCARLLREGAK